MRTTSSAILVCSLLCAGFCASAAQAEVPADELKKLQGTWTFVSLSMDGKDVSMKKAEVSAFVIKADQLTVLGPKGEQGSLLTIKALDPSHSPGWIDLSDKSRPIVAGLYKLDGDQFTLCLHHEGDENVRPKEIAAGKNIDIWVLKRQK